MLLESTLASPSRGSNSWRRRVVEERRKRARQLAQALSRTPIPRPTRLDLFRPNEALVVFSRRGDEIHAWGVRSTSLPGTHFRLGAVSEWERALITLAPQVRDASGWPDAVVPEAMIRDCLESLGQLAFRVWVPLWPTIAAVERVLVVTDPDLPALPWNALLLQAMPFLGPGPKALSLLPALPTRRPAKWTRPRSPALALAAPSSRSPLAEREARAVARIVGGEWTSSSSFGQEIDTAPKRLHGRVLHLAAEATIDEARPTLSVLPLGEEGLPLWRLVREGVRFPLAVFPYCQAREVSVSALGRIVGRVGPEGAEAAAPRSRIEPRLHDASGLARVLVTTGTGTAIVNSWPYEPNASAGVVGTFYAGLARGDSPAQSLLAAQRRALAEGLHPAAWAGFAAWGWT